MFLRFNPTGKLQYWHDPLHYDLYADKSKFIAAINNEDRDNFDPSFAENLSKLENFVMVKFNNDMVVHPRDSQHFEFYYPGQDVEIQPLRYANSL